MRFAISGLLLVLLGMLGACGNDRSGGDAAVDAPLVRDAARPDAASDSGPIRDGGMDSGFATDSAATVDSGTDAAATVDSGTDAGAGVDSGVDSGTDAGAGVDAGSLDPGPVDCRVDADCTGPAASCNNSAPGGICTGCATGTCGDLECRVGACVRDCRSDTDCNAGKRCGSTGICLLRRCGPTNPCPGPYVCGSDGSCERPSCDSGCPTGWACVGSRCVEP